MIQAGYGFGVFPGFLILLLSVGYSNEVLTMPNFFISSASLVYSNGVLIF